MGDGPRSKGLSSEVSSYIVMNDLAGNRFYYRGIEALNWSVIDMNKLKNVTKMKTVSAKEVNEAGADSFNLFYK